MKTNRFKTNINCGGCIKSVTPHLNSLENIESWKVDIDNSDKVLEVTSEGAIENEIVAAVQKAGFEIEPLTD